VFDLELESVNKNEMAMKFWTHLVLAPTVSMACFCSAANAQGRFNRTIRVEVQATVNGQTVTAIPDAVRPHWFIEVKDWRKLSNRSQIQAEIAAGYAQGKRVAVISTSRTQHYTPQLRAALFERNGIILKRTGMSPSDTWEIMDLSAGTFSPIAKSVVTQILSNP